MNLKRVRKLNNFGIKKGPIVYWMSRDQRLIDNWALIYAKEQSIKNRSPIYIIFNFLTEFNNATIRQFDFMIMGLKILECTLKEKNLPFYVISGKPENEIPKFLEENNAGLLICDFSPLKLKKRWKSKILEECEIAFHEVDTHNIIPCWMTSPKQEYAARTIRPKISKLKNEFMEEIPQIKKQKNQIDNNDIDWDKFYNKLKLDNSVSQVNWIKSGGNYAFKQMEYFIVNNLTNFMAFRNDPNKNANSDLSPYLHFGQISAQRIALEINKSNASNSIKEAFLEELIVRKELSDNYIFYNDNYDSIEGFPEWGRKTLNIHRNDRREYIYSLEEFEQGLTHEDLWNAAQIEMVKTGKMHGYMRMYWAKKILEWSESPDDAQKICIFLNDKYELDGRDPNGYVGINWSIGGLHDRPWRERPIFGKVRYMSKSGCKRKFDIDRYIQNIEQLEI
jgi:deoxyribodipyrimidine photo-lyase